MEAILTYRKRSVSYQDLCDIKNLISLHSDKSRRFISQEICRKWNWRQSNGQLKDMVCRSLLLLLESKGLIKQPPRKCNPPNPLANRKAPVKITVDQSPITGTISSLLPIRLKQVRRTQHEKIFNCLINEHHYLGYTQPVGEHLKYIAFLNDRPIACLAWSSAPWYIGARDRFIGWSKDTREKNLHLIANNTRFLILPWVEVSCLASYLLALNRRRLCQDWGNLYNHPIHFVETFVDTERGYRGICYIADNWISVGKTTGQGKLSKTGKAVLTKKEVLVHPLTKYFRNELCK